MDRLVRVVKRVVAEIAQTQQAQAAEVRGGVTALEADVAPLVGLAGDQFLVVKEEKDHHLVGLEVAPELQQQRLVLLVLAVIATREWHVWRQRRVLQIVDDLQHHVRAEELMEANARVGTEAARNKTEGELRGVEIRRAEAHSGFLVEELHRIRHIVLLVPQQQTARLRISKRANPHLRETTLTHNHALDGHGRFGRVVACAEETRDMRLSYAEPTVSNAYL